MYDDWKMSGMLKTDYVRSGRTAKFTDDGKSVTIGSLYHGFNSVIRRRISESSPKIPIQVHALNEQAVARTLKPVAAIKAQHVVLQLPGGSAMHFECVDAERFALRAMLELRDFHRTLEKSYRINRPDLTF